MPKIFLSLGSNLGDRKANIAQALDLLDSALGTQRKALSSMIESESWGFEGGDFVNCVVLYESNIEPESLLLICKDIERQMGRTDAPEYSADGRRIYHDRVIDIDILLYGEEKIDLPHLVIPHPLMHERDFIMRPLREIFD